MLKKLAPLLLLLALPLSASATAESDCSNSPADAVKELPSPLSDWGTIVCTPYGHVISNRQGWIWSYPGALAPVFIPSQMVRSKPEPLGNKSYFTKVTFTEASLTDENTVEALAALNSGFAPQPASKAYKLFATSSLGRSLSLYFFQDGSSIWGIWCDEHGAQCNANASFMVLNMKKDGS